MHGFCIQAGGSPAITSEPGRGTAVTLYLPRSETAAAAPEPSIPARGAGAGTVLLVEDDEDVAGTTRQTLQMLGYQAHHVRDARTALALLLGGQRFDIMLADIVMPGGMSGHELARRVRQHFPDLTILLASGYNRAAAEVDREGFPIIAKPFRADNLSDALKQAQAQNPDQRRNTA